MKSLMLLLITLTWIGSASAVTYRWVDENGITVFSQTPPASGQKADIIKSPPPAPAPTKSAAQRLEKIKQQLNDNREDRQLAKEKQQKAKTDKKRKQQNCTAARKNLMTLEHLGRRLLKGSDGIYRRLTEEERQEKMTKTRERIEENCAD